MAITVHMAPYFPLYVSRSDGKLETVDKTKRTEPNCPTDDQLEGRQDGKGNSDYYKELELGDAREVDWRRKLGGMLIREIGGKEHPGNSDLQGPYNLPFGSLFRLTTC